MKKIRVGVIGLGMGRHHVSSFQNHPNAEVVMGDPSVVIQPGDERIGGVFHQRDRALEDHDLIAAFQMHRHTRIAAGFEGRSIDLGEEGHLIEAMVGSHVHRAELVERETAAVDSATFLRV